MTGIESVVELVRAEAADDRPGGARGGTPLRTSSRESRALLPGLSARTRHSALVDALYQYRFHAGSATRELLENGTGRVLDHIATALDRSQERASEGRPARPAGRSGRARTRALYYATACTVRAGDRPGVAPLRSLARPGFLTPGALKVGLLATGALGNPAAVRAAMGFTIRVRGRLAGWLLGPRAAVGWRPR